MRRFSLPALFLLALTLLASCAAGGPTQRPRSLSPGSASMSMSGWEVNSTGGGDASIAFRH